MKNETWIVNDKDSGLFSVKQTGDRPDIGHLTREYFDYLGEWRLLPLPEGYRIAWRVSSKNGMTPTGDPMTTYFCFSALVTRKDVQLTPEKKKMAYDLFFLLAEETTKSLACEDGQAVATLYPKTPDYMKKDLEDMLKKTSE